MITFSLRARLPVYLAVVTVLGAACAAALPETVAAARPAKVEPVATATAGVAAGRGELAVTIALAPGDPSALATLAAHPDRRLSRSARTAKVAGTAPKTSVRTAIVRRLRAAGLTVASDRDPWNIHVQGGASALATYFGVTEKSIGDYQVPDHDPVPPAGAEAVLGFDTRPVVRQLNTPSGYQPQDLKNAYSVSRPQSTGFGTTVATVQFSGWDSNALGHYAGEVGVTLAAGQLTQVSVDGTSTTTVVNGGDVEVALDQETILGQAPLAKQRAYFGSGTAVGVEDTYSAVASDVAGQGITALSSSWGGCESGNSAGYRSAIQTTLNRLVAAGATFFSASGDDGAYDCATTKSEGSLAVDFPASLPISVAVGGTTLSSGPSETAWSDTSRSPQEGGGGGSSADYARPSYQSGLSQSGSMRLLPDVSSDANPNTGVSVYTVPGGDAQYGGTSLAAPMWASQLADTLSSLGCSSGSGIGDIHAILYAHPGDFTDVTSGNNLYYSATTGYDEATGLGSPIWSRLATDLQPTAGCSGGDFFPLTPTRILDTRNGTGAPQARVGAGSTLNVTVLGAGGIPPSGVSAVVLNVTAVNPTAGSYVSAYPTGSVRPNASNVNFAAGQTVPNLVTVQVGTAGQVTLFNSAGSVDLLADVQGYYSDGSTTTLGSRYLPLTPARLLDTRNGTGASAAMVGPGGTVSFTVTGAGGVASANVTAVALNVTAVSGTADTYVSAFAGGGAQPPVSNLNPRASVTVANLAVVSVGSTGQVTLYNDRGSIDLLADVVGYYQSAAGVAGSRFVPSQPSRVLDTRSGTGAATVKIGPNSAIAVALAGNAGIPANGAVAVLLNLAATNASADTYLTVYPDGVARPNASSLNLQAGSTLANSTSVAIPSDGSVDVFNSTGSTDALADVEGFFIS